MNDPSSGVRPGGTVGDEAAGPADPHERGASRETTTREAAVSADLASAAAAPAPRSRARPAAPGERRFPDEVVVALHEAGVTLGCLPVRIDDGDWRAALFLVVPEHAECLSIDPTLSGAPYAVVLDADLHEHASASVIELGIELRTPGVPLAGSVLFLSGHVPAHFETLSLLASQPDLPLFVGDAYCRQLASQRIPLGDAERGMLRTLLDEAVARDAVIRLTGRYDADAAFDDVLRLTAGGAGAVAPEKPRA